MLKRLLASLGLLALGVAVSADDMLSSRQVDVLRRMFTQPGGFGAPGSSGDPFACSAGTIRSTYYDTATNLVKYCNGTSWLQFATGAAGANTALSNLAAVSINTSLLAQTGVDLGSTTLPFRNVFFFGSGTFGTTYVELTGTPTGARVVTFPDSSTSIPIATQTITWTGPSTARTFTLPDSSSTLNFGTGSTNQIVKYTGTTGATGNSDIIDSTSAVTAATFAANAITIGGYDGTTPTGSSFQGANAVGTDIASATMTIGSGKSTGAGAPGTIQFQVSANSGTGASQNAYKTAFNLLGTSFNLGNVTINSGGAAPVGSLVQGYNAAGTDIGGGGLTLAGGQGTGVGAGGNLNFQVAPAAAGSSGSANAEVAIASFTGAAGLGFGVGGTATVPAAGGATPGTANYWGISGAGTDIAGGTTDVQGGKSTGAGNGGQLIFKVSPNAASGAGLNALVNTMVFNQNSFTLGGWTLNSGGTAPAASSVQGTNSAGTDIAGGAISFNGGQSTGAGTAGALTLKVAPNAATGSSANALKTAATINGTSVTFGTFAINSGGTAPGTSTYGGVNAAGTDIAGGQTNIAGGQSTGAGAAGSLVFQVSPNAATGSSLNGLVTAATLSGTAVTVGNYTAVSGGTAIGNNVYGGVNAAGTDKVGGNTTILPGAGTSAGAGSQVNLDRNLVAATGSAAQVQQHAVTVCATKVLSNTTGTPTTLATIAVASGSAGGASAEFTVTDTDGTSFAADTQDMNFAWTNKAGTLTAAAGTALGDATSASVGGGTLAAAPGITTGASLVNINVTPAWTVLVPTIVTGYVVITNNSPGAVTCK